MALVKAVYKEVKKRFLELKYHKHARVENYESASTIVGASLLVVTLLNTSDLYDKIGPCIALVYLYSLYLIVKTPNRKDLF